MHGRRLQKIGLIHMVNCYFTSMSNIKESVDFIINPNNKIEINRIRINGYNYYKKFKDNMEHKINTWLSSLK